MFATLTFSRPVCGAELAFERSRFMQDFEAVTGYRLDYAWADWAGTDFPHLHVACVGHDPEPGLLRALWPCGFVFTVASCCEVAAIDAVGLPVFVVPERRPPCMPS